MNYIPGLPEFPWRKHVMEDEGEPARRGHTLTHPGPQRKPNALMVAAKATKAATMAEREARVIRIRKRIFFGQITLFRQQETGAIRPERNCAIRMTSSIKGVACFSGQSQMAFLCR